MTAGTFTPGAELTITTSNFCRVYTVTSSNSHRTMLTGPGGARVSIVKPPGKDSWSLCEFGRDKARTRPCQILAVSEPPQEPTPTRIQPASGYLEILDSVLEPRATVGVFAIRTPEAEIREGIDRQLERIGKTPRVGQAGQIDVLIDMLAELRRML